MKNSIKIISVLLPALLFVTQTAFGQQSLNGIRLQDANSHVLSISAPLGGFTANYNFRFPSAVPAAGAIMYSSDGLGQSSWLPAGGSGQILSFSGGLPIWSSLSSLLSGLIEWDLSGNAVVLSYNGLLGSFLGTSNNQPLVLATTNILTPQPIEFYTNNAEKMRLTSGGELGIGLTPTAGKLLHVSGTSGTSNVRFASLASATGTTGRVMFATDATGDLQDLAFPASSAQVLSSTTTGVLSWTTPSIVGDITGTLAASTINSSAAAGNHIVTALNLATVATLNADPLKHDATLTVASNQLGVATNGVGLGNIAQIGANTILGNNTAGAANVTALTTAQVKTLLNLTGTNSGDITLAGTGTYLSLSGQAITQNPIDLSTANATGVLAAARFPALAGDVTTVAGALGTTIANNAVTYAKMQNTTAASVLLGRNSTGAGAVGEITLGAGLAMSNLGVLSASGSGGTVTSVSVVTANGVSGTVATPTTTPAITLTLGAITPSSVAATGTVSGSNISGTNSGDVTLAGTGTYLSLAGQAITQNPIDLSSANASGTLAAARFPALTGDVTTVAGALGTTIGAGKVTYAKIQNEANNTILGNVSGAAAAPSEVTAAQLKTLINLTGTNSGDITLAGTGTYLSLSGQAITQNPIDLSTANATGVLAAARFPALAGDVTTVAGALGTTIANNAVTYAKMQNTTAASVLLGRNSTGAGAIGEITLGGGLAMSAGGVLSATGSGGTVTSVSVTTANGVSGVVATPTTTPAITLTLGAITPTSVAATGTVTGSNISGTNSGDVTLAGTGTYLSLTGQAITQNPIDLSSANASGVLAAGRFPALTGDVTTVAGALATTIGAGKVTYAKIQNETNNTILGNVSGISAAPAELTSAQIKTLLNLTGTNSGDVTLAGTGTYLSLSGQAITQNPIDLSSANATGTLAAARFPALTGDETTVAGALGTTIANNAVTYAKIQNTTAASVLLGRNSTSAGAIGEITLGAGLSMSNLGVLSASGFMSSTLTANHIFVGSAGAVATDVAMSGDVNIISSGATTIQPAAVTLAKMANLAANSIIGNNTGAAATPIALTTAQVKTMLSLNNVENTALSTWAGSTNITTLGIIGTGTWNGTAIGPTVGGTGQTTYTTGDILYASAANTLSKLPIGGANNVLSVSGGLPSWQTLGSIDWQLAGNSVTTAYNGTTGSFIGTTNTQPLVLATTNTTTAQPIDFYTNNAVKMRLNAGGFLSVGGNFVPTSPLHIRNSNANSSTLYLENTATNGYTSIDFKNDAGTVGNVGVSNSAASAFPNQYYFNISAGTVLPITFNQNTNEKMAIDLNGNLYVDNKLGVGFTSATYGTLQTAGRAFNVAGTAGTVNVRMTSLGSATPATTGGVLYADGNGDLNRLAVPGSSQQVLSSATDGTLSWATALVIPLTNTTSTASTLLDLTNSGSGDGISATASGATAQSSFALKGVTSATAASSSTEVMGVWGLASSTNSSSAATTGVRGEGNGTTTDANSNVALQAVNGEFVVGRQASNTANDNSSGNNILASGEDDNDGLTDQGPSGVVDITDGGNPAGSNFSAGTLQVFNRYAKAHSIILITPMTGGTGAEGSGENIEYSITARAAGSFTVQVRRSRAGGNAGTSGTWRVGFLIVNPGK